MSSRHTQRGFTLVEFIIAMAILIFGAYAIYEQFHKTARPSGPSEQKLLEGRAQMLAHQLVAELQACSHEALKAWEPRPSFVQVESQPRFHAKTEKCDWPSSVVSSAARRRVKSSALCRVVFWFPLNVTRWRRGSISVLRYP